MNTQILKAWFHTAFQFPLLTFSSPILVRHRGSFYKYVSCGDTFQPPQPVTICPSFSCLHLPFWCVITSPAALTFIFCICAVFTFICPTSFSSLALTSGECVLSPFSHVQLIVTLWTAAHQALLSMGFSRQEYWSGLPCSPLGDLPNPGIEPASPMSPALAGGFFTTSATWEALTAGGVRLIYSFTPHVQAFRWGLQQCQYFPQDYMLTFHQ